MNFKFIDLKNLCIKFQDVIEEPNDFVCVRDLKNLTTACIYKEGRQKGCITENHDGDQFYIEIIKKIDADSIKFLGVIGHYSFCAIHFIGEQVKIEFPQLQYGVEGNHTNLLKIDNDIPCNSYYSVFHDILSAERFEILSVGKIQ